MLKKILATVAMSIAIVTLAGTSSQAMNITSAARTISVAAPVHEVAYSERTELSRQLFCLQYSTTCRKPARNVVVYSSRLRTQLASVNRGVNRAVPQARAQREFISLNLMSAGSDEYAITKRSQLIRAGVPAGAMHIESATDVDGLRHSVLVVATSAGELVLDHRTSTIRKRRDTGYSFAALEAIRFYD